MGQHYVRRFDLSKYSLKSFDSADEFCADTNNGDQWTYNANGTVAVLANNIALNQSVPTPFVETASAANGGTIPAVAGGPATATTLIKYVTGIADATPTPIITVTVPNAQNSGLLSLTITAIEGAGGAVGAGESIVVGFSQSAITRTAGLATVAAGVSVTNNTIASVAGATLLTNPYVLAISSNTGANSATQTFTINLTIAHASGASTNHTALVEAVLYNAIASGITIA